MSFRNALKFKQRPILETLDDRVLLTTGLTASLSRGVLSIAGTSADASIVVDVLATRTRRGVAGVVAVEGVGTYKASQVKQVLITAVTGEAVAVNHSARWNPAIHGSIVDPVTSPLPTSPPSSPPTTTVSSPPPTTTPTPVSGPTGLSSVMSADEQAIVDAVNLVRAQNGLAPLVANTKLVQMAHLQAQNMATYGVMEHTIPQAAQPGLTDRATYVGYSYSQLGENIAFNFSDTASVMNAWMNSPDHRANILGANYTQIGVGIAYDSAGQPYYSQEFGDPLGS